MVNKIKWLFPVALVIVTVLMIYSDKSNALADPVGTVRVFQKSCGTTAAPLCAGQNCSYQTAKFWVNSATPVFIGGSDVDTSTKGMPYCTDTASCISAGDSADAVLPALWCKAGSSVTVTVLVGKK